MVEYNAKYFAEQGIEYIQYQFSSIFGELKLVEFPARNWEEMKNGAGVDGSSLGYLNTEQSDMRAIPDYETYSIIPWQTNVARFICNLMDNNGEPYPTCPRGILKKVIGEAAALGYHFSARPELEWYFIDEDLDPADEGNYMCSPPLDIHDQVRRNVATSMMDMFAKGSPHTIHHECGPGQQEIELTKLEVLAQADNVLTGKIITKTEAYFEGLLATFMPKPYADEAGSGLHIHLYMEDKEGNNLFADANGISDILKHFIGGILNYTDEITALLNPITNSYKRLVPNHEAPVFKAWGMANRTALIRVPGYESKAHIEYRAGDGGMNIYLGLAALIAAGVEGIKNKMAPNTPTIKNVDHMAVEERAKLGITQLPQSLKSALNSFKDSEFIKKIFGEQFIRVYLDKKVAEVKEYEEAQQRGEVREWETQKYLDC